MIISLEGPDSSGKSTQAEILYNNLTNKGLKAKLFHFPRYESPIGSLIGKVLKGEYEMSFESLQKLYVADQIDFEKELDELIFDGYTVILDRYDLSTIAYYTAKKNIDVTTGIKTVTNWQGNLIRPNVTFVFSIENSLSRREESTFDILENDKTLTSNINLTYLKISYILSKNSTRKFKIINANLTKEEISSIIDDTLNNLY